MVFPGYLEPFIPYISIICIIGFILLIVPGLIWIERVVIALMQDRIGPNRVGPRGLLQAIADGVKLFFKEDVLPKSVDRTIYYIAPLMSMVPALAAAATIPFGDITLRFSNGDVRTFPLIVGNVNIGVLYLLGMTSLGVYGIVLGGWSSNNKYSLLGGLRSSAQMISYELAMSLAILCVLLRAGSLNLVSIVKAQEGGVFHWFWLGAGIVPFVIYTLAMIAETNRAPFDLPEAESELIAGFHTEYSSMKFAMFFMGEYAAMLTVSALNATLFWGGWLPPFVFLSFIPGFIWMIAKIMFGILFYVWLRATLPRLRYDALMNLGWKRMLPLALIWLFLIAAVMTIVPEGHAGRMGGQRHISTIRNGAARQLPLAWRQVGRPAIGMKGE